MSKAGSSLLRTTLVRAADKARRNEPQLTRIYYVQMIERDKDHLGAVCVVATSLAERFWAVMHRGMPTSSATPTAARSTPTKPKRSSPNTGPSPPTFEPAVAATRRGRPPKPSEPDSVYGATFANTNASTSTTRTVNISPSEEPLDNEASTGEFSNYLDRYNIKLSRYAAEPGKGEMNNGYRQTTTSRNEQNRVRSGPERRIVR